ncbi:MAG TPA: hypothetical protein VFM88_02925 [Vicinamibacteria bacterium]|nr:hypothetical protein [Vicinamibacteria bacterium]
MKPKRARRGLVRLATQDLGTESELPLFLGRLDAAALRRELDEALILEGLRRRGYVSVDLELRRAENEHRFLVRAAGPGDAELPPLVEVRCAEEVLLARDLEPRPAAFEMLSVLAIRWLAMQDPRARFDPERPPLPGQRFPGLGLVRPLILRIHAWAKAWGKDALVNFPEFFHNAVLYSSVYRFVSPARQGIFEALVRDLARLPLAASSAAVEEGRVAREGSDERLAWEPGEMIAPITEAAHQWLAEPAYAEAVRQAREGVRFRVREAG